MGRQWFATINKANYYLNYYLLQMEFNFVEPHYDPCYSPLDDRVVAEIDVSYTAWPLGYYGEEPSELSTYLICQEGIKTSKYLSLSEDFCGMTTKCTQNCKSSYRFN